MVSVGGKGEMNPFSILYFFLISFIFHEIGHIVSFYLVKGRFPKITLSFTSCRVGVPEDYSSCSRAQLFAIYLAGPIWGISSIILFPLPPLMILLLVLLHLYLSKKDLSFLVRIVRKRTSKAVV